MQRVVERGGSTIKVGPWSDAPGIGHLVVLPGARSVDGTAIDVAVEAALSAGFHTLRTGALGPEDATPFESRGFTLETRLVLLRRDLTASIERRGMRPRRLHRGEWAAVAALDALSFPRFWHFDEVALREACAATAVSRVRLIGQAPVGYVIVGQSMNTGFVQRLAVHPAHAGQGIGRALVVDGLRWLHRRRVAQAFVNTQYDNTPAIGLYESLGFTIEPRQLVILSRTFPP